MSNSMPEDWSESSTEIINNRKFTNIVCKCGNTIIKYRSDSLHKSKPFCKECQICNEGHKWILGLKGLYSISENGEVYSYKSKKYLANCKNGDFLIVNIDGVQYYRHKLVALVFNGIDLKDEICFSDGDKENLHYSNLKRVESVYSSRVGCKYGKLRVTAVDFSSTKPSFICKCDCGNFHKGNASDISNGHTKSCGCATIEAVIERNTTHNLSKSPEYRSWSAAKTRCTNKNSKHYSYYGGRGIKMCGRWSESFENFYEDMGERPIGLTLDRIDPNGDYEPSNCRWATYQVQGFNQRMRSTNTSGRTGVYLTGSRFLAMIGKEKLGTYDTFKEAEEAREAAELKYFGYTKGNSI